MPPPSSIPFFPFLFFSPSCSPFVLVASFLLGGMPMRRRRDLIKNYKKRPFYPNEKGPQRNLRPSGGASFAPLFGPRPERVRRRGPLFSRPSHGNKKKEEKKTAGRSTATSTGAPPERRIRKKRPMPSPPSFGPFFSSSSLFLPVGRCCLLALARPRIVEVLSCPLMPKIAACLRSRAQPIHGQPSSAAARWWSLSFFPHNVAADARLFFLLPRHMEAFVLGKQIRQSRAASER